MCSHMLPVAWCMCVSSDVSSSVGGLVGGEFGVAFGHVARLLVVFVFPLGNFPGTSHPDTLLLWFYVLALPAAGRIRILCRRLHKDDLSCAVRGGKSPHAARWG